MIYTTDKEIGQVLSFSSSSTLAPLHKKKCLPPNFESTFQSFARIRNIFCSPHCTQWFYKLKLFFTFCWLFEHFHHSYFGCILRNFLLCSIFFLQIPFGRLFWLELWTLGNKGMISLRSFWFLGFDYQDFLHQVTS